MIIKSRNIIPCRTASVIRLEIDDSLRQLVYAEGAERELLRQKITALMGELNERTVDK